MVLHDSEKDALLQVTLVHAVFDGWSDKCMQRAAKEAGVGAERLSSLFPGGAMDVLLYFIQRSDQKMLHSLTHDYNLESMKVRERIATAIMVRLQQQHEHKEAIKRGMALIAMPWHAAKGMQSLYNTVDAIWRAAGDRSTDFNFYTKRSLLAKVYMSTLLFWLNDTSDDMEATRAFLYRRIENVMQIQKWKAKMKAAYENVIPTARAGKEKAAQH